MLSATHYPRHDKSDNKAGKSPVELAPPCSLSLMQRHNNRKKKKKEATLKQREIERETKSHQLRRSLQSLAT